MPNKPNKPNGSVPNKPNGSVPNKPNGSVPNKPNGSVPKMLESYRNANEESRGNALNELLGSELNRNDPYKLACDTVNRDMRLEAFLLRRRSALCYVRRKFVEATRGIWAAISEAALNRRSYRRGSNRHCESPYPF